MNGYNNKENEKGAFLLKFNSANKHLLYDTQVSTIYIDYLQTIIHEKQKKKIWKTFATIISVLIWYAQDGLGLGNSFLEFVKKKLFSSL